MNLSQTLLAAFYLLLPAIILYLEKKSSLVKKIGAILFAYGIGIVMGLSGLLPEGSIKVQEMVANISVPLAIPLMLFSTKIRDWFQLAGNTFKSLLIGFFAITITVVLGYLLLKPQGDTEYWKVAALLTGVYTGGTPNLAALKTMLQVENDTYLVVHTYDMLFSAMYLFFLISVGQRFFLLFLPAFKRNSTVDIDVKEVDTFDKIFNKKALLPLLKVFGVSIVIFGMSFVLAGLFDESVFMVIFVLALSTLALLVSLWEPVNKVVESFDLGMYFILMFSLSISSMVNIDNIIHPSYHLIWYPGFVIFGSLLIQAILSKIFKVDTDTMMVTTTALVCSPPFVPMITTAIGNKNVLVPGITVGLIGYALGNYPGFFIGEMLRFF